MKLGKGFAIVALALVATGVSRAADAVATNAALPSAWLLDGVAAQVNDETITISEVMAEIRNSAWIEMSREDREKSLRKLYTETLNAFIDRRLILAAAKVAELKLQPWVIDDRVQEIIDTRYKGNRTQLMADLTTHRVNFDMWKKGIEEDMMLMAMRSESVDKQVTVSPREVRSYYETNRQAMVSPPRVHIGRITLQEKPGTNAVSLAQLGAQVLRELDAPGADFASVARKYSQDSFAPKGGDRGWIDPEDLVPALVQALAPLQPGQCTGMVTMGEVGIVLKKIEEQKASTLPLDEAWLSIERRLRMQKSEALYREWTARLRQNGYVKIFDLPPTPLDR